MNDQYRIRKLRGKRSAERREAIQDAVGLLIAAAIAWGLFDLLASMFGQNR